MRTDTSLSMRIRAAQRVHNAQRSGSTAAPCADRTAAQRADRTTAQRADRTASRAKLGFTLAEVAVTIVIVGIGLLLVLQGLNTAKITAAHTRNFKLARDLALLTLGQIESGEYQKDIQNGLAGSYADQGYSDFTYEVVVGDASFTPDTNTNRPFDSWAPTDQQQQQQQQDKNKDKDQQDQQPFEKVKIRITFPKMREFTNELILERWMPWKQVYGDQNANTQTASTTQNPTPAPTGSTPPAGTGR
jgi:prepilin-type N-terminal cleavage/methylation domain-containing protein